MKRSQWPLYSAVTLIVFLLTGFVVFKMAVGPELPPYEIKSVGLGTRSTVVIAISSDCSACEQSIEFYKRLMELPLMDGTSRRLVVVAMNGAVPVHEMVTQKGLKPHRLTSGPYMRRTLPGVSQPGTILLLDADGNQRGKWVAPLSPEQEQQVIRAVVGT